MKFRVKLPAMAGPSRFAGTVVVTTRSPKLVPAGVFTGLVVPLKVMVVVPCMLVKLTTLVPLMLKTPVVLKVTGSALASAATIPIITVSRTPMRVVLNRRLIDCSPSFDQVDHLFGQNQLPHPFDLALAPRFKDPCFHIRGGKADVETHFIRELLLPKTTAEACRSSEKPRAEQEHAGRFGNLLGLRRSCFRAELDYYVTESRVDGYSRYHKSKSHWADEERIVRVVSGNTAVRICIRAASGSADNRLLWNNRRAHAKGANHTGCDGRAAMARSPTGRVHRTSENRI